MIESESGNMIKLLWLLSEMMLSARSIARASLIKMELSSGRVILCFEELA